MPLFLFVKNPSQGYLLNEDGYSLFEIEDGDMVLLMQSGASKKISQLNLSESPSATTAYLPVVGLSPWPAGLVPSAFWEFTGTPGSHGASTYMDTQSTIPMSIVGSTTNTQIVGGPLPNNPQVRGIRLNIASTTGHYEVYNTLFDNLATADFTIGLWFQAHPVNGLVSYPRIWSKLLDSVSPHTGYELWHRESPDTLVAQAGNGGTYSQVEGAGLVSFPEWDYYSVVFVAATGHVTIYRNGVAFVAGNWNIPVASNVAAWVLGGSPSPALSAEQTLGAVAQVGVWQKVLTPAEILSVMNVAEGGTADTGTERSTLSEMHDTLKPILLAQRTIPARTLGVTYHNSTGYAMNVSAGVYFTGSVGNVDGFCDSIDPPVLSAASCGVLGLSFIATVAFIVPPNYFYRITTTTGSGPVLYSWSESPVFGG